MDITLKGKYAVVCGSSQGIGLASAKELAQLGANITLIARNEESTKTALDELPNTGEQKHQYLCADFDYPERLRPMLDEYLKHNPKVHILVNNSGGPPGGPITEALLDEFDLTFARHLKCNHILALAVIPSMKSLNYGRIINIISTSVKAPLKGLGVSNTIRAAVASWAKTLATELAPMGITVNNVLPGATLTSRLANIIETKATKAGKSKETIQKEMLAEIPAGRFASPEEVANAVAFLATPAAAYITGINLPVDGGRTVCL